MAKTAAAKKRQVNEDRQGEYIAGGNSWLSHETVYLEQTGPYAFVLTPEARERMKRDAEVKASLSLLADSVFADGMEPVAAVKNEDEPEYAKAKEIAEFVKTAISDPQRPLETVLREMFKETFFGGVKVAEIVLKAKDDTLILDRVNPKPNSSVAFFCDKFYNVLGIVPVNQITEPKSGTTIVNGKKVIRRDHFLVMSFELCDNDPRGVAEIEGALEDWCEKQDTRKQWKEWRRTSAIPKKWVTTAEKQQSVPVMDADGKPVIENGRPKVFTPEQQAIKALEGFANNSSFAGPFGTKIGQLEVQGTGQQFINAIKYNNSQIRKIIVGDALTTGEADKDARAARESAKDVSDIRKQNFRRVISDNVKKDIFRLLTVVNFGEEFAHLTPDCFLGDTEANDWATDLDAASGAGYEFAPEHFPQLDVQFGLEPRKVLPQPVNKQQQDPKQNQDQANQTGGNQP